MMIFGDIDAKLIVYCENAPAIQSIPTTQSFHGLQLPHTDADKLSIEEIVKNNGNHWRKIFNIYAKIAKPLFQVNSNDSWQQYRDCELLKVKSKCMLTCEVEIKYESLNHSEADCHIIMGKRYFQQLREALQKEEVLIEKVDQQGKLLWFKTKSGNSVVLTPYFDYRQFPNKTIDELIQFLVSNS